MDGPRDLKFEMVARTVGRETASLGSDGAKAAAVDEWEGLDEGTRRSVEQVLKYRGEEGKKVFEDKARDFAVRRSYNSGGIALNAARTCCSRRRTRWKDIDGGMRS